MTETTLAWVKGENIKAVRNRDGVELLMVNDLIIPIGNDNPVQHVIDYCALGKRDQKLLRQQWMTAYWQDLRAGQEG